MEILAGATVILVLVFFLGLSIEAITAIVLWILGIITALIEIFFIYALIKLIATTPVNARFTKIEKAEGARFESAYYKTAKGEYPNVFPCEAVMRDKFYNTENTVKVRVDERKKKVYDKNAVMTIIAGFVAFTAAVTATVICMCCL